MRKLASIQKISEIIPHDNADRLEIAKVNNWQVVVRKGDYSQDERIVFFEIDSFIPEREDLSFIPTQEYNGVIGHRIRTLTLRGVRSQGLIMPLNILKDQTNVLGVLGEDVTENLGVLKYEKFIADIENTAPFPYVLKKSEQERIQNIVRPFGQHNFFVTEKLDGESMTLFMDNEAEVLRVCSRNLELTNPEHYMFKVVTNQMYEFIYTYRGQYALQGELIGPKIQDNIYKISKRKFYGYAVWDIVNQCYVDAHIAMSLMASLGVEHVPIVAYYYNVESVEDTLEYADGYSKINPEILREGLVMWSNIDNSSFKVISNKFLEIYE